MNINQIPTPSYVVDEAKLKENLTTLQGVQNKGGCKILLAQKAYSAFATYPMIGEYLAGTSASGLYEAKLGAEEMGKETHVFSPAYTGEEMQALLQICDHIVFNSLTQTELHLPACRNYCKAADGKGGRIPKFGLRINPEYSTQSTEIYDPCGRFSRLGITRGMLEQWAAGGNAGSDENIAYVFEREMPEISGLHFHTLCEQMEEDLEKTFAAVEKKFGDLLRLPQITWLNLGGGHHITKKGYDRDALVRLCKRIRETYGTEVYLEPGEAVALDAGYLVSSVMDIVYNEMPVLILDASAACHMPDVLEMPYTPPLQGARAAGAGDRDSVCRLSSRTCLAGDIIGDYVFDSLPRVGDRLIFEDMAIYSMVKNNTFNGMPLPTIYRMREDGQCELIKDFTYEDFKGRLS